MKSEQEVRASMRAQFQRFSDRALEVQRRCVIGGWELEELNAELARRGQPASAGADPTTAIPLRKGWVRP